MGCCVGFRGRLFSFWTDCAVVWVDDAGFDCLLSLVGCGLIWFVGCGVLACRKLLGFA